MSKCEPFSLFHHRVLIRLFLCDDALHKEASMPAKQFCVLTATESRAKICCQKMQVAQAAVRSVVVLLLLIHCLL